VWSAGTVFVCALTLLGRSEQSFPTVEFVQHTPPGVSRLAEAYVLSAESRIVVVTSTAAFKRARRAADRCGDLDAIREIAGVLAHEEWHLQHGVQARRAVAFSPPRLVRAGAVAPPGRFR
jgi:hypothetical protein